MQIIYVPLIRRFPPLQYVPMQDEELGVDNSIQSSSVSIEGTSNFIVEQSNDGTKHITWNIC